MLRSQVGVEDVENPYGNLKQGLIKIKARKDKPPDLAALVKLLEEDVGFEPVTEVTLELRGSLARREKKLFFEVSETGQKLTVEKVEAEGDSPPEGKLLAVVAILADPHSADRIIVRQWKAPSAASEGVRQPSPAPARLETVELSISGMT